MRLGEREIARETARWVVCGAVILGVHGGAAAVLAAWPDPQPAGSPQTAILMELAPVAAAPPAEKSDDVPDVRDSKFEPENIPEPEKKIEQPEPEPPREAEKQPEPEPEPEPPKQAEVVLPKVEPPKPKKVVKQRVASIDRKRVSQDVRADHAASATPGASGAAAATYGQMVRAHLMRHKGYPQAARANHIEGTVTITFTLSRSGSVVSSRISRGSGHAELDQETLDMLRRAQPFPAPPPGLSASQLAFIVPLHYNLRNQ
jgi:protein TonB